MDIEILKAQIEEWGKRTNKLNADIAAAMKPFEQERADLDRIESVIEDEVLALNQQRIETESAYCIITCRGTYDWKKIALQLRVNEDLIEKHTSVDWKAVADATGLVTDGVKKMFYTSGTSKGDLKLKAKPGQ